MKKIIGRYMVKVKQDSDPESPREWDNLGVMVCFRRNSTLGDKHDYKFHDYNSWDEMGADIAKREKVAAILPLYVYEHGGMTMNTTGFSCPWDSGQVGFIYMTKKMYLENFGGKIMTAKRREHASQLLVGEVETYDKYLTGEVYGFEVWKLKKNGKKKKMIDSCWGYYDEDECMKEGEAMIPEQELAEEVS